MTQNKPSSFENSYAHNSEDILRLKLGDTVYGQYNCQTVANYNWGEYKSNGTLEHGDSVAPGNFKVKLFVEPRAFHGRIHGIIDAVDLDGQPINSSSMQVVDGYQTGRWLIHDKYSFKTGKDTNYAWSAGCFIMSSHDLESFNSKLEKLGLSSGDIIEGVLIEE